MSLQVVVRYLPLFCVLLLLIVVVPVALLQCFAHSWYLANDMQLYVISPLILLPLFLSVSLCGQLNSFLKADLLFDISRQGNIQVCILLC